jgi:hypothetical protein
MNDIQLREDLEILWSINNVTSYGTTAIYRLLLKYNGRVEDIKETKNGYKVLISYEYPTDFDLQPNTHVRLTNEVILEPFYG